MNIEQMLTIAEAQIRVIAIQTDKMKKDLGMNN